MTSDLVDAYAHGRRMYTQLKSQLADLAALGGARLNPQWLNSVLQKRLVYLNLPKFLRR